MELSPPLFSETLNQPRDFLVSDSLSRGLKTFLGAALATSMNEELKFHPLTCGVTLFEVPPLILAIPLGMDALGVTVGGEHLQSSTAKVSGNTTTLRIFP